MNPAHSRTLQSPKRWPALDFLKAVSIFSIVTGHVLVWWLFDYDGRNLRLDESHWPLIKTFFNTLVIPGLLLPATAGVSMAFYKKPAEEKTFPMALFLKRGAFLIALGYMANYLAWGKTSFFEWDALQMIGLSIVLLSFLARFSSPMVLALLAVLMAAATPSLQNFLDAGPPAYWKTVLGGDRGGNHYWPLFPWFSMFIVGFLLGRWKIALPQDQSRRFGWACLALGFFLFLPGLISGRPFLEFTPDNLWGARLFRPSLITFVGETGYLIAGLGVLDLALGQRSLARGGFFDSYSRGILWIYLANIIIGFRVVKYFNGSNSEIIFCAVLVGSWIFSYAIGFSTRLLTEKIRRGRG